VSLGADQRGLSYPLGIVQLPTKPVVRAPRPSRQGAGIDRGGIESISAPDLLDLEVPAPEMLIEGLWQVEGCGYLAGEPKCLKTFTVLEMGIAINTGGLVFGQYHVKRPGPVLLVLEETKLGEAKQRLEWLMRSHGITAASIQDLHFLIQQGVRLDREDHWDEIRDLCARYSPVMTVFDPLARMHDGPENQQECMSPILRHLRSLQADFHTAVAVTHHLTKPGAEGSANLRMGHRIRGTSDQHSWLDCALYFTRKRNERRVRVESEHRESPGTEPFFIELEVYETAEGTAAQLHSAGATAGSASAPAIRPRITTRLAESPGGLNISELFRVVGGRKDRVQSAIAEMVLAGEVVPRSERRPDERGTQRWCKVLYAPVYVPPLTRSES